MRTSQIIAGVVVLALLGLLDVLSPWLMPAPPEAPAFADPISIAFGVATLIALAVWVVRPSRVAMWVAVVLRAVSALFAVPAFLDAPTVAFQAVLVVVVVATIVGIVLVRGALGRSRTTAGV